MTQRLRIFFRLLFLIPLVVLGIDGSKPHGHPINESMFWTGKCHLALGYTADVVL